MRSADEEAMGVAIQYRMRRRLLRRLYFALGEKLLRDALR